MALQYHLTLKSRNGKTGPIPVSTTAKASCPDCPLSGNGCYAELGPLSLFWQKVSRGELGTDFDAFLGQVAALPDGQLWRHNQAGDLPGMGNAIDGAALAGLARANHGKRGFTYTHKPMTAENARAVAEANAGGFTVNLSGNNVTHADTLADMGIAPVVTVLPIEYGRKEKSGKWAESLDEYRARVAHLPKRTPAGRAISVCPAAFMDTSCADCQLCARQCRKSVVGFPGHGGAKAKADAVARG